MKIFHTIIFWIVAIFVFIRCHLFEFFFSANTPEPLLSTKKIIRSVIGLSQNYVPLVVFSNLEIELKPYYVFCRIHKGITFNIQL